MLNRGARIARQDALAGVLNSSAGVVAQARFARLLSGRGEVAGSIRRGAAAAAAPVQLLKDGKSFLAGVRNGKEKAVGEIADALDFYQRIPKELEASQDRLRVLREIDRRIALAHASLPEEDGPPLLALYRESEQEHREIVAELVKLGPEAWSKNPKLLPVDLAGLKEEQIGQIGMLWQSFLSGQGNLRIRQGEDPAFVARMQSAIAKLLQGAEGRKLITSLGSKDRGKDLRVTLGADFTQELLGTKAGQGTGSEAIPLSKLVGGDKSPFELQEPGEEEIGTVPVGKGLYKPGQQTGSFVRIVGAGAHTLPSKNLRPALTPEFITVGHELGHASRFQTGGSIPLNQEAWTNLGVTDPLERELWSTPEEYVNITGVENALRAEHWLEERRYHQSSLEKIRGARATVANLEVFREAMGTLDLNSLEMKLLEQWPPFVQASEQVFKADLDWSKTATLKRMLEHIKKFRKVARVLHQLELSGRTPEKLHDTAEEAGIWSRLRVETDFMDRWRRYKGLYARGDAEAFVTQAPDLADQLAGTIDRVTVEVAVERSERSSSLSEQWFGGFDV